MALESYQKLGPLQRCARPGSGPIGYTGGRARLQPGGRPDTVNDRPITPCSAREMAALLEECNGRKQTVRLGGNDTKVSMGGPVLPANIAISTSCLQQVLQYEPNDLTISVGAGMPWLELQRFLSVNGQMVALDPPGWPAATVGGVVATNSSGPFRRAYGSVRDLVIGMTFATLEGKLVKSGGMVVKNVAGLDMAKLLIGSFGTLAAITSVNFRLHSRPETTATWLITANDLHSICERRNRVLESVLQPLAIDMIGSGAAAVFDRPAAWMLAVRAAGSEGVLARYRREFDDAEELVGSAEESFWNSVRHAVPKFLHDHRGGAVIRTSTLLQTIESVCRQAPCSLSRAGSGVTYSFFPEIEKARAYLTQAAAQHWTAVIEHAPEEFRDGSMSIPVGPERAAAFDMMKKIKQVLDPHYLLNRKRLYGFI